MRTRGLTWTTCALVLSACANAPSGSDASDSSESASTSSASETSSDTGTTTDTDGGPPLSNGPTGASLMVLDCAPNDGLAWTFTIGLGSGCDMSMPDPNAAFVQISAYDYDFLTNPVGMTIEWSDWQKASGYFAPDGQAGMTMPSIAGSLHIDAWDNMGEVGSTITGWYTLSFEAGDDIGASFEATFCGGSPMCG